jgi:hypothetical protein
MLGLTHLHRRRIGALIVFRALDRTRAEAEGGKMATATAPRPAIDASGSRQIRLGSALMLVAAIGFIGYAVIFFVRNYTDSFLELGIGQNEVNVGKDQIVEFSPQLYHYISHLHIAVSGFIAATGLAVACLAWFGVRKGLMWAWVAAVAAPVLALAVALPAHYPNNFDTLGHLGLIYLAVFIFVVGAFVALPGLLRK